MTDQQSEATSYFSLAVNLPRMLMMIPLGELAEAVAENGQVGIVAILDVPSFLSVADDVVDGGASRYPPVELYF